MAIAVEIHFADPAPPPDDCPTNLQETVDILNELVSGSVVATITPYIRQAATPGVDQQDLIWHRIDVDGRPLGTYVYYSGVWRKEYSGKLGEIVFYSGDPAVDFAESGSKGTIGGDWDGWQICNGNNGSPNLSDKFIVGAKMDDLGVGYPTNGPWKTNITGAATQTGGDVAVVLTEDSTWRAAKPAIELGRRTADGETPNPTGGLFGYGTTMQIIVPADPGNETPDSIPTLPNYYALAYAVFQGYA